MNLRTPHALIAVLTIATGFAATASFAAEVSAADLKMASQWAQGGDTDKDHMLSKAEVLALVEKAFANADSNKSGKLDMKQVAMMLREFDPRAASVRPASAKP